MQASLKYPHLDLKAVNAPYLDALREAADRVIGSGWYVGGPEVKRLEDSIASMLEAPYAVGVASGLDALRLILMAYVEVGVLSPGDEVIVPANTYIASLLAISQAGLVSVPADPSPLTMNITAEGAEAVATPRTRAIMPVHLYGRVAWDQPLADLVRDRGWIVVEDCAQALGASSGVSGLFGSSWAGALGHAAGLSFYPTKNLGALGDAGMVVTHSRELADTVRALANYGSTRRYHNDYIGLNSRLDPIQAAFLSVKLPHLHEVSAKRAILARAYSQAISNPLVTTPLLPPEDQECVWHQYVVRIAPELRDAFRAYLLDCGVGTDVHYPTPPHLQPCYSHLQHGPLPVAEALSAEVVSLPISQALEVSDIQAIAGIINDFRP